MEQRSADAGSVDARLARPVCCGASPSSITAGCRGSALQMSTGTSAIPTPRSIVVQYTGGYTLGVDLPPDIEAAVLIQLQQHKAARSRDQTIRSESVPNVLIDDLYDRDRPTA